MLRSQSSSSIGITDSKEKDQSSESTNDRTVTPTAANDDDNERILVEKDGVFKLMTTEEHTAYEKKKKQEAMSANKNKELSDTASSVSDKSNTAKKTFSASSQVIPRPPARAKTDTQRPKTAIIQREVIRNSSLRESFTTKAKDNNKQDSPKSVVRISRSADPARSRTRSKRFVIS